MTTRNTKTTRTSQTAAGRSDVSGRVRNHRLAGRLGVAGAGVGFLAGLVQLTIGSRIPEWTGAKSSPVSLGLLTMVLSLLAGAAALRQREDALTTGRRTACAVVILGTGLVCSTTVGWLWWWLPAPLLFAAGALTVDSGRDSLRVIRDHWARVLLTVLGGCELVMAAGAGPLLMSLGAVGGLVLVAIAWTRTPRVTGVTWVALVVAATAPFAVLGWTAIAPVLVMLSAVALVPFLDHGRPFRQAPPVSVAPLSERVNP